MLTPKNAKNVDKLTSNNEWLVFTVSFSNFHASLNCRIVVLTGAVGIERHSSNRKT